MSAPSETSESSTVSTAQTSDDIESQSSDSLEHLDDAVPTTSEQQEPTFIELDKPDAEFISSALRVEHPVNLSFDEMCFSVSSMNSVRPIAVARRMLHPVTNCTNSKDHIDPRSFFFEKRQILHSITGSFEPGRLVAIMGPSGAGKTSLLNILARRVKSGHITGKLRLNGRKLSDTAFNRVAGYVTQEDTLIPTLSPKELLWFSAQMRLPHKLSYREKVKRINETLEILSLKHCASTVCGEPGVSKGLSGGERRRTSIAMELLVNPRILFLDEPTSGLDSKTSEQVCSILRSIARQGRTVVATIHQPSPEVFSLFDDVYLLAKGRLVYSGPVKQLLPWFTDLGYPCPQYISPSDYYMRLLAGKPSGDPEEHEALLKKLQQAHDENRIIVPSKFSKETNKKNSSKKEDNEEENDNNGESDEKEDEEEELDSTETEDIETGIRQPPPSSADIPLPTKGQVHIDYNLPWEIKRFLILYLRTIRSYTREKKQIIGRLIFTLALVIFISLFFANVSHTQSGIRDLEGVLFMILTLNAVPAANNGLHLLRKEEKVFYKEFGSGYYSAFSYYLAKILGELPLQLFFPALFASIVYWIIGLKMEVGAFFIFVVIVMLTYSVGAQIGIFISIVFDPQTALSMVPLAVIPWMITAGLLLALNELPVYLRFLQYISFFFYGYAGLCVNEFKGEHFHCDSDELSQGVCPITTGRQVLETLDFDGWEVWPCVIALVTMYVGLQIASYFSIAFFAKRRSKV